MLQRSAFTLSAPAPAMAGQISRHMANGWLGELFMSLALMAAGGDFGCICAYPGTVLSCSCYHADTGGNGDCHGLWQQAWHSDPV